MAQQICKYNAICNRKDCNKYHYSTATIGGISHANIQKVVTAPLLVKPVIKRPVISERCTHCKFGDNCCKIDCPNNHRNQHCIHGAGNEENCPCHIFWMVTGISHNDVLSQDSIKNIIFMLEDVLKTCKESIIKTTGKFGTDRANVIHALYCFKQWLN